MNLIAWRFRLGLGILRMMAKTKLHWHCLPDPETYWLMLTISWKYEATATSCSSFEHHYLLHFSHKVLSTDHCMLCPHIFLVEKNMKLDIRQVYGRDVWWRFYWYKAQDDSLGVASLTSPHGLWSEPYPTVCGIVPKRVISKPHCFWHSLLAINQVSSLENQSALMVPIPAFRAISPLVYSTSKFLLSSLWANPVLPWKGKVSWSSARADCSYLHVVCTTFKYL